MVSSRSARRPEVLIATLGSAPQVGTLTFDELYFRRQVPLRHVVWVHTRDDSEAMREPVARVRHEVATHYAERAPEVTFEFIPITGNNSYQPTDTLTEEDLRAVLNTLYEQILRFKKLGYDIHLAITGGRKVISAFGVTAAQLTFESDNDRCWHLLSEPLLWESGAMHAESEHEIALIPVPVLRWSAWKGFADRSLAEAIATDPLHAQNLAAQLSEDTLMKTRLEFIARELNEEERQILRALALHGWENAEIDAHLHVACKNVLTRLWKRYCDFLEARFPGTDTPDPNRMHRGRFITDFHLPFQHLERASLWA